LSEAINPWVYSLQLLFKSTNNSWRYERKCEWVFFSEHRVYAKRLEEQNKHTNASAHLVRSKSKNREGSPNGTRKTMEVDDLK